MRVPKSVRRITDPVLGRIPVPVLAGVNRGRWWNLTSAGSGYVSGRRAGEQMQLLRALVRAGDVVWDVGAHHGYVTLMAAAKVGGAGRVHAFEPDAMNARLLERHVRWNRVRNVRVHRLALGSFIGEAAFGGGRTSRMHSLGRGEGKVVVTTARGLIETGKAEAPTFVKIDVEGAEAEVLRGMIDVLPPQVCMIVAMHSAAADAECASLLSDRGFDLVPTRKLEYARRHPWPSDPDLICTGPAYNGPPIQALLNVIGR